MQDEALNLLLESCGGTRMGHILLTLPHIRSAADRQLIQVRVSFQSLSQICLTKFVFILSSSAGITFQKNRRRSGHREITGRINAKLIFFWFE